MLKYKEWKQLNESFLGPVTLGLKNVQNLGIAGSNLKFDLEAIEEAKKGKKKMLGEIEPKKVVDDEEKVDLDKVKIKDDDEELEGDDEELEGDDEELEGDEDELKKDKLGDKDLGGGEKEKVIDEPMFAKKGGKGKKKACKKEETMTTDEQAWWNSLNSQVNSDPDHRYSDGTEYLQKEDAVIPPSNSNAQLDHEPEPGEAGYAPQGRLGGGVAKNPVGNWAGFSEIESVEQGIRQ